MNEKALKMQDLEKIFVGFEKRQDKRFASLFELDGRLSDLESQMKAMLE